MKHAVLAMLALSVLSSCGPGSDTLSQPIIADPPAALTRSPGADIAAASARENGTCAFSGSWKFESRTVTAGLLGDFVQTYRGFLFLDVTPVFADGPKSTIVRGAELWWSDSSSGSRLQGVSYFHAKTDNKSNVIRATLYRISARSQVLSYSIELKMNENGPEITRRSNIKDLVSPLTYNAERASDVNCGDEIPYISSVRSLIESRLPGQPKRIPGI